MRYATVLASRPAGTRCCFRGFSAALRERMSGRSTRTPRQPQQPPLVDPPAERRPLAEVAAGRDSDDLGSSASPKARKPDSNRSDHLRGGPPPHRRRARSRIHGRCHSSREPGPLLIRSRRRAGNSQIAKEAQIWTLRAEPSGALPGAPIGGSARGYQGASGATQQARHDLLDDRLRCIFIHHHLWVECPHLMAGRNPGASLPVRRTPQRLWPARVPVAGIPGAVIVWAGWVGWSQSPVQASRVTFLWMTRLPWPHQRPAG
jgi:hypothetical protein